MEGATKKLSEIKVGISEHGIKDLSEAMDLVESGLDATTEALKDGKVNWMDLPKFAPVIGKVKPALEGINNVWPEIKDLDPAETQLVVARMGTIISKATALFAQAGA